MENDGEWDWFDSLPGAAQEYVVTLRQIAEAVATQDVIAHEGDAGEWYVCPFCNGERTYDDYDHPVDGSFKHEPTCIVLKARAAMEQK